MMDEAKDRGGRQKDEGAPEGLIQDHDLFLGLIQSFQAAAMQQMGKVMNPFTEKIERDMAHAKMSIEMLEMLRVRTQGNLTGPEARFLNHVLTELRLNYVAEIEKDRTDAAKGAPARPEGDTPA